MRSQMKSDEKIIIDLHPVALVYYSQLNIVKTGCLTG